MKNRLIIINSFDYGSTGTLCSYLKKYSDGSFNEPIFLVSNMRKSGNADYYLYEHSTKIIRFLLSKKNETKNAYGFCSKRLTRQALDFALTKINLNEEKIIISIHQVESSLFDLKTIFDFAAKYDCKVFLTLHDCWPFTGKCAYYDITNCRSWMNEGCCVCNYKNDFPSTKSNNISKSFKKKIEFFIKNKERLTFVCPSKWIFEELGKSKLNDINKVIINNGIEIENQNPSNTSQDNRVGLISVAYPWTERKGIKYLNYISQHLDFTKYKLTIVGLDDKLAIPNAICYNKLDRKELFNLYRENDYFLNPTLEDNFPTVNIEALSCGLKIISFKTGGSCEIFDEKTGYAIERGNQEEMLKVILSLNKNVEKDCCVFRAKTLFSKDKFCEMYYNLFKYVKKN